MDIAAEIGVQMVHDFVQDHPGALDRVTWVLFDVATQVAYENEINNLPH